MAEVFIAGGALVYAEALERQLCDSVYVSWISEHDYKCDVRLPAAVFDGYVEKRVLRTMVEDSRHALKIVELQKRAA